MEENCGFIVQEIAKQIHVDNSSHANAYGEEELADMLKNAIQVINDDLIVDFMTEHLDKYTQQLSEALTKKHAYEKSERPPMINLLHSVKLNPTDDELKALYIPPTFKKESTPTTLLTSNELVKNLFLADAKQLTLFLRSTLQQQRITSALEKSIFEAIFSKYMSFKSSSSSISPELATLMSQVFAIYLKTFSDDDMNSTDTVIMQFQHLFSDTSITLQQIVTTLSSTMTDDDDHLEFLNALLSVKK
eukprot:CAMPEP_0117420758 /NCGR_PEP_ID=MMETSP0758-20121206/2023_1 /TAXON_ID=63605 /ORGANISM="Percolomonas cosmopolitus, Strain AE-1 (ATCC 50343)" /LENGTH=246 /DNA_ID=CAMNT_0005202549 /DNA_START=3 /DNA_END=743 /DNA_ORIENTATION=+